MYEKINRCLEIHTRTEHVQITRTGQCTWREKFLVLGFQDAHTPIH